ncbi:hypothetical protein QYF36_004493 [Acer negundo]|nr:hypothetical protein QYF36_004493 [Acer negundo]
MQREIATLDSVTYDRDLYGGTDSDAYVTSIPVNDEDDANDDMNSEVVRKLSYTALKNVYDNLPRGGADEDNSSGHDAFAAGEKTPDPSVRTYANAMRQQALEREEEETLKDIAKKKKEEEEAAKAEGGNKRRNRWDQSLDGDAAAAKKAKATSDWDLLDAPAPAPGIGRWDATPTPGRFSDASLSVGRRNRWDETLRPRRSADADATPARGATPGATPAGMAWDATLKGATPAAACTPGVTPVGAIDVATPTPECY